MAARLARVSPAGSQPVTWLTPSARAENSTARWLMLLSPGTRVIPFSVPPGVTCRTSGSMGVESCGRAFNMMMF